MISTTSPVLIGLSFSHKAHRILTSWRNPDYSKLFQLINTGFFFFFFPTRNMQGTVLSSLDKLVTKLFPRQSSLSQKSALIQFATSGKQQRLKLTKLFLCQRTSVCFTAFEVLRQTPKIGTWEPKHKNLNPDTENYFSNSAQQHKNHTDHPRSFCLRQSELLHAFI